jgi:CheY-like chemotaxis protein
MTNSINSPRPRILDLRPIVRILAILESLRRPLTVSYRSSKLNIVQNKPVLEALLSNYGLEAAADQVPRDYLLKKMDGKSISSPIGVGIHEGQEFSNASDTPLKHGPVEKNDARLGRADVPCAAWSHGTIAVGPQGIVPSDRQLDSYPVLVMSAEPQCICIIDDDASVRNSIVQLLDSDGLKAQSFEDAEDFLAYARSHAVALAIVDVWMPKTSGLEVQAQLQVVSPNTKVIIVTGQETPAIRAVALQGGAFAFLVKPFDDESFLSLVRQAIRSAA